MPLIHCPACSYEKETDPQLIPEGSTRITCPQCQHQFEQKKPPAAFVTAPPPASSQNVPLREIPFTFHGRAGEYFGIWIVNTLLKIVTLGFYSPWAKVRKRRYLYGNTRLENQPFDYLADPKVLLRGFILGVVLLIAYSLLSQLNPLFALPFALLFFLATPWLVVRSRMFNNRNTSHRNLRFNFAPNYKESYSVFTFLPFLTSITLGLAAPYVLYRQKRFLMENNGFGQTSFSYEANAGDYYRVFLRLIGVQLLLFSALAVAGYALWHNMPTLIPTQLDEQQMVLATMASMIPIIALSMLSSLYLFVRLSNLNWNNTHVGGHYFNSRLQLRKMFWIIFSNMVAISLSAGLLMPWATIRLSRYRVESLSLIANGSLNDFIAGKQTEISAIGEEIGDVFDIEMGL